MVTAKHAVNLDTKLQIAGKGMDQRKQARKVAAEAKQAKPQARQVEEEEQGSPRGRALSVA